MKCAIVRDSTAIYLLGGKISNHKIITKSCQKFNPLGKAGSMFTDMPNMNLRHNCPSACFLGDKIWVFSQCGI